MHLHIASDVSSYLVNDMLPSVGPTKKLLSNDVYGSFVELCVANLQAFRSEGECIFVQEKKYLE